MAWLAGQIMQRGLQEHGFQIYKIDALVEI